MLQFMVGQTSEKTQFVLVEAIMVGIISVQAVYRFLVEQVVWQIFCDASSNKIRVANIVSNIGRHHKLPFSVWPGRF